MINSNKEYKRVVFCMVPYWPPLLPPQGLARIKQYIGESGYNCKTFDANIEVEFKEICDEYFKKINECVPKTKQGNIFDLGYVVLRNQMMGHGKCTKNEQYINMMRALFKRNFQSDINEEDVYGFKEIIDKFYQLLKEYIANIIEKERPDVIGLSVYSDNLPASMVAFEYIKSIAPNIITIMGGAIFAGELIESSPNFNDFVEETGRYIDKILIGQGEQLILSFLKGELDDNQKIYHSRDIPNGVIDISHICTPNMTDFKIEQYPYIGTYASKGCPNKCSFCTVVRNFGEYQERDIDTTINEIKFLQEKYKKRAFFMLDSLMNPYITNLSNGIIQEDLSIYIDGYLRISEEVCDITKTMLWRKGGIYRVRIGVESGSQHVLDLMSKGISVDQTRNALASLSYAGIKTTTYWVIGHPGETEEDFNQTLKLLESCKDDIWQAECHIFEYFYDGQPSNNEWELSRELLYPKDVSDLLVCKSWTLNTLPSRETSLERVAIFAEKCRELGIPNPNTISEINYADIRWKNLHSNAVPSLIEIQDIKFNEDKSKLGNVRLAESRIESIDFNF
ncbi:B12-binding domain-containing radical SAM protein [Clostridium cellulovorans]|uniref:Radical SAM domain protein n=1 Tax=Clostridium cellulovorans (strain ATCC 35296 / DSM 3052 / OCM 3 / 743B) TaxID=573061 RepID=D9SP47_CLOC7|nr:B12-binding domain-containing radical SAM protein [Clostridium cellulovorans]ADL52012.1 Radical SAM domain protein [Clostridium cellulovorans 743B]